MNEETPTRTPPVESPKELLSTLEEEKLEKAKKERAKKAGGGGVLKGIKK